MSAPVFATWLLERFRPGDEPLIGDLLEEHNNGRSRAWYWRQMVIAIVTGSARDLRAHPLLGVRALATGWILLLLFFGMLGDLTADALANLGWGWTRDFANSSGVWRPFHISAELVSYAGFAISAWAVARWYGMPMVLAYASSIVISLAVSAAFIEWLERPIPVPHTLFYLISPSLPYVWRSGFVLAPLVILTIGLLSSRRVSTPHAARSSNTA